MLSMHILQCVHHNLNHIDSDSEENNFSLLFYFKICKLYPQIADENGVALRAWCCHTSTAIPPVERHQGIIFNMITIFNTVVDFTKCRNNVFPFYLGGRRRSPFASAMLARRLEI